jgi:ubiquinol-cytochrome c reductase cytochrome c subunit
MRRVRNVLVLAAVALFDALALLAAAGPAQAQPGSGIVRPTTEPSAPSLELGRELFEGNCASCHGFDGQGVSSPRPGAGDISGMGPPLRGPGAGIVGENGNSRLGVGAMGPDFYLRLGLMPLSSIHDEPGNDRVLLSGKEIRSLIAFIASIAPGPGIPHPDPAAGNLSDGMQLFTLHCAGCHQEDAEGGFLTGARVPPLQGVPATQIAEAVRIGPYEMPAFSTRQLSNSQLNSIVRYVLSTNHENNAGGWRIGNIGPIPEGLVTWWIAVPLLIIACMLVGRRFRRQ